MYIVSSKEGDYELFTCKHERYVPNDIRETSNDIGKVQAVVQKKNVAGKKILIPGLSLHPCILLSRFYCTITIAKAIMIVKISVSLATRPIF